MAGFATRPSFAGHTGSSAKTNHELTSTLDHQMGAGQSAMTGPSIRHYHQINGTNQMDRLESRFGSKRRPDISKSNFRFTPRKRK